MQGMCFKKNSKKNSFSFCFRTKILRLPRYTILIGLMLATSTRCLRLFGRPLLRFILRIYLESLKKRFVVLVFILLSILLNMILGQFRERYRGFKIPLDNIPTSQCSLVKQLAAAGTRIKAHISQADSLRTIKDIIEVTEEGTNVSETSSEAIADELSSKASAATVKRKRSKSTKVQEELLDALVEDEEECLEELEELARTTRGKKAAAAADAAKLLSGKFVDLTDLIPPLPDKGSFEVENIKKSQYFFS